MLTEHQKDELARYVTRREMWPPQDEIMWAMAQNRKEQLKVKKTKRNLQEK